MKRSAVISLIVFSTCSSAQVRSQCLAQGYGSYQGGSEQSFSQGAQPPAAPSEQSQGLPIRSGLQPPPAPAPFPFTAPFNQQPPPGPASGSTLRVWNTPTDIKQIMVTTTSSLDGYSVRRYIGLVRGLTVRQPTMQQNMAAGMQGMFNVNIEAYAQMCDQAREQSYKLMLQHALALGANAVLAVRYDSTPFSEKFMETEVLCYGTAVYVEPLPAFPNHR